MSVRKKLIITNNPMVYEACAMKNEVVFEQGMDFMDVLLHVRNRIHAGGRLLTHPLSGSIKPFETPYKTVLMEMEGGGTDMDSLSIIEKSIETAKKLHKPAMELTDAVKKDFQLIDFDLVMSAK